MCPMLRKPFRCALFDKPLHHPHRLPASEILVTINLFIFSSLEGNKGNIDRGEGMVTLLDESDEASLATGH